MAVLVLAEKPSVSQAIAAALGVKGRRDGYIEGNGYIISWCVGHLVELANADCYDARYSKWAREDLPILPAPWKFTVSPGTKKQFKIIQSLMERSDVSELIEATDAGREGELIFRLVYREAGCKKPFKRLWISSMEDSAIRAGFENLMPGEKYDALYEAALCRAKADWLVGINATRLFTTLYRGKTLNVGRVMTPTLALLADREQAVTGFQKEKFYTVDLDCGAFCLSSGRFKSRTDAEKLRKLCMGKNATVQSAQRQERAEKPPKLYDLTTLQREANRIYGYTAQQTLDYIQLLYEKKLATYPRTDSRYLTEDMAAHLPALCQSVAAAFPFASGFDGAVEAAQVVCNAKVSDHHAIIPTKEVAKVNLEELPTGERNILSLTAARLLCAVCPEKHKFADTAVVCICADTEFTAKGRMEISAGWKGLEQAFQDTLKSRPEAEKTQALLPELSRGETVAVKEAVLHEGTTSPPARYTEDSLLSAMENAGAEEFAQIEDAERKGLGTPATRAGVIEKLVRGGFVERKKKLLVPTARGMELIKVLPEGVKSAGLTAEWEAALKEVERRQRSPEDFMEGITDMVCSLVKSYGDAAAGTGNILSASGREAVGKCPRCGKPVYEGKKSFYCSAYKDAVPCGFALWKENPYFKSKRKELTKRTAAALLKDGKVKMTGLYSEKKGIMYDATIVMEDTGGKYVNFRLEFGKKK
ncbi:DNA topoisomerase III [bacterium 1xD8-48]|nr:DNA topoisomerase 3 [uncultured Acetatifactor sp.]NBJ96591.1 DNA topoisomerase III [bacterium 1xD8-48]